MRHTMAPNITVHDLIALAPLSPRPTLFVHQVSGYLLRVPFVDSHQVEARVLDSTRQSRGERQGCAAGCICVWSTNKRGRWKGLCNLLLRSEERTR